jgi:hypothetical protein
MQQFYDDWGNLTSSKQDRNSTVATSGGDEYTVSHNGTRNHDRTLDTVVNTD